MASQTGQQAEQLAKNYLEQQGLIFVEQNVRFSFGEIDLIMQDGSQLVFVEVKYRSSQTFGGALNALSAAQIKRIRKAAEHYIQLHRITQTVRLDVVAINGSDITWLTDAF